jgi:hypothetical protein
MTNPTAEQIRIANATKYQVNEVMSRFFPELLEKAISIVESEKILISKNPKQADEIKELTQLKLDTLAPNHYMNEIRQRRDAAKREVVKAVKVWAKDKVYGKYLNAQGQMDQKKLKTDFIKNGRTKEWLSTVLDPYNTELIPYATQLEKEMGAAYSPEEVDRGEKLNVMLHKHNTLVNRARSLITA